MPTNDHCVPVTFQMHYYHIRLINTSNGVNFTLIYELYFWSFKHLKLDSNVKYLYAVSNIELKKHP